LPAGLVALGRVGIPCWPALPAAALRPDNRQFSGPARGVASCLRRKYDRWMSTGTH
jgi:hypothetical protein